MFIRWQLLLSHMYCCIIFWKQPRRARCSEAGPERCLGNKLFPPKLKKTPYLNYSCFAVWEPKAGYTGFSLSSKAHSIPVNK